MNYEVKKLDNSVVEITLKLEGAEVAGYKKEVLATLAKKVEVPGFRKGHAPASAIEAQFAGVIKEEMTEKVLHAKYEEIITENNLKPVNYIMPKSVSLEGDKYEAVFTVDVYPEFELGTYKGLEAEKESFELTEDVVEAEIKAMLERGAKLEDAEEGYAAQMGDTVDLGFEGFIDGVAFEGGKADSHTLKLGSKMFIDTFEEQLVGYTAGQEGEVVVNFPVEYHAENLAGKPATFKVKINAIKKSATPELNEEYAKEQGFESVEDLRTKKGEEITAREEARIANEYRGKLLQQVSENTEVAIPVSMIEREVKARISEMEQQLNQQGMNMEMYLQMSGMTIEKMAEQIKPMALNKIKMDIVLDAIAKAEALEVTEEELATKMEDVAKMYGMDSAKLEEELTKAGNLNAFKENVKIDSLMQKTVEFVVANAK